MANGVTNPNGPVNSVALSASEQDTAGIRKVLEIMKDFQKKAELAKHNAEYAKACRKEVSELAEMMKGSTSPWVKTTIELLNNEFAERKWIPARAVVDETKKT